KIIIPPKINSARYSRIRVRGMHQTGSPKPSPSVLEYWRAVAYNLLCDMDDIRRLRGFLYMKKSIRRLITTHTGSLPRSSTSARQRDHVALAAMVKEMVRRQTAVGLDIINDGEAGKASYATYVTDRLSGF